MVDHQTVCCMCGDVGFPDKLFRCTRCRYRFQHSYCSNYYSESCEKRGICDWCQSEETKSSSPSSSSRQISTSRKSIAPPNGAEYSGDLRIKQHERDHDHASDQKPKSSGVPSPKPSTRRYKLLKDVMC